jgi:hypothetical protein
MPESIYPLIYWPVGIALRGRLFFEIACDRWAGG